MKKGIITICWICLLSFLFLEESTAQCAMCKATAEQSDQVGLNLGILYLFLTPYIIVATLGFFWWKNKKKEKEVNSAGFNIDPRMN